MKTPMSTFATGIAALVLAGTAGCGGGSAAPTSQSPEAPTSQPPTAAAPAIDVSVVRGMTHYDYEPARSLQDLASGEPSATLGEVVGWSDGRSLVEGDGSGYVDTSYFAVLEIKVVEAYRAVDDHGDDERIHVEVPRGGEVRVDGEKPEGTEPVHSTMEDLNRAVPTATRVIVVGREAPTAAELESDTPDGTVQNVTAGRPDGDNLLRAHVQGLIFEDETGAFTSGLADDEDGWGWLPAEVPVGDGFDHLIAELDNLDR